MKDALCCLLYMVEAAIIVGLVIAPLFVAGLFLDFVHWLRGIIRT